MDEQFQQLALTFPTIQRNCPGIEAAISSAESPRHGTIAMLACLRDWLWTGGPGGCIEEAERQAALFILNLWRRRMAWPDFDLYEALACWDEDHRAAFQAWAMAPWRP